MDRRRFLKTLSSAAGFAATGLPARSVFAQSRTVNRVIVIGAGIVGASIAYYLSKRGCDVVIIDKNLPAMQASGNTFAWINAAYPNQPDSYRQLRQRSLDEYRLLGQDIDIPIRWSGSLEWFQDSKNETQLVNDVESFRQASGAPTSIIDAQAARDIEPALLIAGDWQVAWSTNDGAIDSATTTQALFDRTLSMGAQGALFTEVNRVRERRNAVRVSTTRGRFEADLVVVASGIGTASIAEGLGERIDTESRATPGIIVTTEPLPKMLNTVVYPPLVHMHQQDDGRVVIGEKAGAPAGEMHLKQLAERPNSFSDDATASAHVLRILAMARSYLPELSAVRHAEVGIGWRPMPEDGLPIIGHGSNSPNVYFATMHSGVSLAPIVGKLASGEILDGARFPELADFRPGRFQPSALQRRRATTGFS